MNDEIIACIVEGAAEEFIMKLLLDNDKLIFSKNNLLEEEIITSRSAKNFEETYLNKDFGSSKIKIYRILDSKKKILN